ncbi:MAG: deoxyribodipyrimidine photolyase [Myxococcota bacterium]
MLERSSIPAIRVQAANDAPVHEDGDYVLYWMIAYRRHDYNFALERAVEWAKALGKPLVVLEALRVGYRWASDRLHTFVIEGMHDNAERFTKRGATYYPYLERAEGEGKGLVESLAERACVVVTDDFPCFFLPRMVAAVARRLATCLEVIDGNGLLPTRATDKVYARAHDFRRHLQRTMPTHIHDFPKADPLRDAGLPSLDALPEHITTRWPAATRDELANPPVASLPIDHSVPAVPIPGGIAAAGERVTAFLDQRLGRYGSDRNQPDVEAASGLSPYLHFGHMSAHRVFRELAAREDWHPDVLVPSSGGKREGWWQMSPDAESFLDELITWREVGFNMTTLRDDYDQFSSLPAWTLKNFDKHAADPREYVYDLETFERAQTHDDIWNAAQTELVTTGRMHNYLRMLWGKKILEWTARPEDALAVMIELNNKYALDGRNPNSYSGIFWCLGRYDRAWGPERPIFGTVRFMSSDSTRRKLRIKPYLAKYGAAPQGSLFG